MLGAVFLGTRPFPVFVVLAVRSDVLDEIGVAFVEVLPDDRGQVIEPEDAYSVPVFSPHIDVEESCQE